MNEDAKTVSFLEENTKFCCHFFQNGIIRTILSFIRYCFTELAETAGGKSVSSGFLPETRLRLFPHSFPVMVNLFHCSIQKSRHLCDIFRELPRISYYFRIQPRGDYFPGNPAFPLPSSLSSPASAQRYKPMPAALTGIHSIVNTGQI